MSAARQTHGHMHGQTVAPQLDKPLIIFMPGLFGSNLVDTVCVCVCGVCACVRACVSACACLRARRFVVAAVLVRYILIGRLDLTSNALEHLVQRPLRTQTSDEFIRTLAIAISSRRGAHGPLA